MTRSDLSRLWSRVKHRIGHRGSFLLFLALLDFAYGYSLIAAPPQERVFDLLLPWAVWGWIWVGTGAVLFAGSLVIRDRIAYSLAALLKVVWAGVFAEVWLVQNLPRGFVSVVVWAAFALTVILISGWPEPWARNGKT